MKFGWPISLAAHGVLGTALLIGFSSVDAFEPQEKIMQVHLATIDEVTNIKASVKRTKPKPVEPVPVEEPMTLQTPMENAPEEGDPETRTVEPEAAPEIVHNSEVEAEVSVTETDPTPKPFDPESFSDVVNRARDKQPIAGQQQTLVSEQNFLIYSQAAQAAAGEATALTVSEIDALRQRMHECWRLPIDATNPKELSVEVHVLLQRDGTVADVYLESPGKVRRSSNPFMAKAARDAVNAVKKCSPYDFLPLEKYASWQDMVLRFTPEV